MNFWRQFTKPQLLLGVLLLCGAGALLQGIKLARSRHIQADTDTNQTAWARTKKAAEERKGNGHEAGERRGDHPDDAIKFRRLQLQDERGEIPADGLEKARQRVKQMRAAPQSGVKSDSWEWLGPGNIGGRIRAIVIDPANANRMWIGSAGGGIWASTDAGAAWTPRTDFAANLAVSTMVINPANRNILYAGSGEGFGNIDALQGAGIFQSTDAGLTWNQLAGTANANFFFVNRLAISSNGNTLLAATGNGIWQSTNGGTTWVQGPGVAGSVLDIDFDPTDNQKAIAGLNGRAFFSVSGGLFWFPADFLNPGNPNPITVTGRVEIAYAPSNPAIVYALVDQNQGNFYRSTNGGQSYTRVNSNIAPAGYTFLGTQGWYDNIVWVNPQDSNFVVVGGVFPYRSTDGGLNFTGLGDSSTNLPHTDHHMIVAHPGFNNTTNRTLYFGNDGGLFRLNDVGVAPASMVWVELNNNLGITQFYGAAGTIGGLIGGTQDNGNVRFGGTTENWVPITGMGGDGGFCAADPTDSHYYYGEYIYLQISRSINSGISGTPIFNGIADANNAATANFIAPFILDPNDANTMLAGGISLWRSTNVKMFTPNWAAIKAPTGGNSPISAIVVSPVTSSLVIVGHNNGDIYRTFNGTAASPVWTKIDTPGLPNRMVMRLVIDGTRSTPWYYATFGGFSPDNIYRSTDHGATWTDLTGSGETGLPDVPVRSLVYHPSNANLLYAGTEIGVFTSDDAGAHWELPQNGPANVSVEDMFWLSSFGGDLIAATHGRGLFRASVGNYVDCNYNGVQVGTFAQPFKTITAALNAATTYRTIWLKPCTYTEPMTINKRVEIRSLGGNAIIRKP